jgi:multiple sugar transport system permease protein
MTLVEIINGYSGIEKNDLWVLQSKLKRFGLYLATLIMSLVYVFPMYWMVKSSIEPSESLWSSDLTYLPTEFTLYHFERLLFDSEFLIFFRNSVIVAIGVTILTVVISVITGYALTRFEFSGKRPIANLTIFSYMYPPILLGIPMFMLWHVAGLLNSYPGLILAQSALTVPFSTWLMWQFFQTVPISLEESTWIYGASRFRSFFDVAVPMAMPGIIAISIFAFAVSWNDFTLATILMREHQVRTLPVGVMFFIEQDTVDWGLVLSAGFFIALPPFLLVYFMQKYLLQGFRLTS